MFTFHTIPQFLVRHTEMIRRMGKATEATMLATLKRIISLRM